MKKLFKVTLVAMLGISLAACGEAKDPGRDSSVEPSGEMIGGYHFTTNDSRGIDAKVIKDEDGCVFMVSEVSTRGSNSYSHDIEFMGGCDFSSLYEK